MKKYAIEEKIQGFEVRGVRKQLKLTQAEFARLANVSVKTVERWESSDNFITGPVVTLVKILKMNPSMEEKLEIPEKQYPLRLFYMHYQEVCTVIDVNERKRAVKIYNYTNDYLMSAFGGADGACFRKNGLRRF